jgi:hypothetical protein
MTDRAAKRRAIADKLAADIARLPAAIAKSREGTKVRARLEAQLERAQARFGAAKEKADLAEAADREKQAKKARIKAANVGYMKRLDALQAAAPAVTAQWAKEREEEGGRIAARKKQLDRRTTKDLRGKSSTVDQPGWMRRQVKLPEPIQQPDLAPSTEPAEQLAPPREGLIPGTFRLMDPERIGGIVDRPRLPKAWTARQVGIRLIEAHRVLGRIPTNVWPKEYGAAWPSYQSDFSDHVIQAGAGTLFSNRRSPPRGASAEEMARMSEAICWPMQFLSHNRTMAADLNWWAFDTATDDFEFDARSAPWEALQFIANALNAANEVVR